MEPLIFRPYKRDIVYRGILTIIFCVGFFAYLTLENGQLLSKRTLVFVWSLVTVIVLSYSASMIYIIWLTGYRTKVEVCQQGFALIIAKRAEPVFVPWGKEVYMCLCADGANRDTVLCFSNRDIGGRTIKMNQTVNYRQTFETDAGQPWVVALTYGSKAKCRKDAARIRQYMDGCLQQTE